ncbi:MAG: DUF255 domain-containing protein [Gammaproteobacteria bacterium]|nr:DUF255 domain-containing protein [Gammaproteobacteria bacterium]
MHPRPLSSIFLLLVLLPLAVTGNTLRDSDSPYLAMHGDDPVDWQPWSAEVLAQAKRENKLLFVSIGYFACHWCHVMQRETYRDEAVAGYLNEHFISIKVDRELNLALDAYLIEFVTRTRGSAGWPLNVFLTPDGHPLVGMTYLPTARFETLLRELQDQWLEAPDYFRQVAAKAAEAMKGTPLTPAPALKVVDVQRYEEILVSQALALGDDMSGGFGEQTKFPLVPHLRSLLAAWQHRPDAALEEFLTLTLDRMALGGLRDQLGGGFFRYTVDPDWYTPHFEKMLYGNAQLAVLYLRAAQVFDRPDYAAVARDTLDFMLREMMAPAGGMMASFSAVDEAGAEGGYYLWDNETLQRVFDKSQLALMQKIWGMQGVPPYDDGHLPMMQMSFAEAAKVLDMDVRMAEKQFQLATERLLVERRKRQLPVDHKILAGWNGLALTALVAGARQLGDVRYRQGAQKLRNHLLETLWDGQRLWRARGKRGELGQATLEDYAFAAQGLLDWAELTNSKADRQMVRRWVDDAWRRFHDGSGWRLSDQTLLASGYGVAMFSDSPLPSPSVVLMRTAWRLAGRADDKALRERVLKAAASDHTELETAAFEYAGQVELLAEIVR